MRRNFATSFLRLPAAALVAAGFLLTGPETLAADQATLEACVEGTGVPERDFQYCTLAILSGGKEGIELASLHVARGLALAAVGSHEKAIADYDHGLTLNPHSAAALHARGLSHQAGGRWAQSIRDFDQAIELFPKYFNSFRHRGTTRLLSGDAEGAGIDFDKAIALDPSKPEVFMLRGIARYLAGPEAAAVADFERTAGMAYPQVHLDIWRRLARRGADETTAAALPKLPTEFDEDSPPWLGALTALVEGRGEAAAVWATLESVRPGAQEAAREAIGFYLALAARARGDGAAAREALAEATRGERHRSIEGALARVLQKRGE